MNIPNILTIVRIFLTPLFMIFLIKGTNNNLFNLIALLIFIIASITDFLDGFLARKKNIITNLGKFLDPLADKILISGAFLCFLHLNLISIWVVFIVFVREFLVIFIRLIASQEKIVIAANFWGKLKTVFQIITTIVTVLFLIEKNLFLFYSYNILTYISVFFTALSGIIYFFDNLNLFFNKTL